MKDPLDPIPTEQNVSAEEKKPRDGAREPEQGASSVGGASSEGRLDKAYPWLLGSSICLSALLCWMYVTKPVIVQGDPVQGDPSGDSASPESTAMAAGEKSGGKGKTSETGSPSAASLPAIVPSEKSLPGDDSSGADHSSPEAVDPGALVKKIASVGPAPGWERTNLRIQHILSADPGNGALEKIVLNVPVLYQTRTMRWTPSDIAKAREVMARLMVYERNLNSLRKEGEAIMRGWNILLENTVPSQALRADSPSLPVNHGQSGQSGGLPGSPSVIQVEQ